MSDGRTIHSGHPLWKELRNGLLWHRTSITDYQQIKADGFIQPNDGRADRWGGQYACQQLGGISLFDFTSQSEKRVLGEARKWQQFLGDARPVTVLLGLERGKLSGRLIPYPDSKQGTTGNVIPWVEVCHCGLIPVSAIVSFLLICAVDYRHFRKFEELDDDKLTSAELDFIKMVQGENQRQAKLHDKIRAIAESPEFKARLEEAKRRAAETKSAGGYG